MSTFTTSVSILFRSLCLRLTLLRLAFGRIVCVSLLLGGCCWGLLVKVLHLGIRQFETICWYPEPKLIFQTKFTLDGFSERYHIFDRSKALVG
jgi:hypothetical protein